MQLSFIIEEIMLDGVSGEVRGTVSIDRFGDLDEVACEAFRFRNNSTELPASLTAKQRDLVVGLVERVMESDDEIAASGPTYLASAAPFIASAESTRVLGEFLQSVRRPESTTSNSSHAPRLQGMTRALVNSMVQGVANGYERQLELRGTGYRAELKGSTLHLALGFSHPVAYDIPKIVKANIPGDSKGTLIVLSSPDKAAIGQTAATIRGFRPPEPYGGKGVRYKGERVREKAGKAGKGGKKYATPSRRPRAAEAAHSQKGQRHRCPPAPFCVS